VSFNASTAFSVSTDTGTTVLTGATVASNLSSVGSANIGTQSGASDALKVIDGALAFVDDLRARWVRCRTASARWWPVGRPRRRTYRLRARASRMRTSRPKTANLSRAQILQQAGTAMLAQANQQSQNVLTLLR